MKAVTYLEWSNLEYAQNRYSADTAGMMLLSKWLKKDKQVRDFYSQPFKPEMITEYFEGWIFCSVPMDKDNDNYRNKAQHVRIWFYLESDWQRTMRVKVFPVDKNKQVFDFILPKTLDHFISDALRAGIELTFKPEITEKYFK